MTPELVKAKLERAKRAFARAERRLRRITTEAQNECPHVWEYQYGPEGSDWVCMYCESHTRHPKGYDA